LRKNPSEEKLHETTGRFAHNWALRINARSRSNFLAIQFKTIEKGKRWKGSRDSSVGTATGYGIDSKTSIRQEKRQKTVALSPSTV
jgi:hypothetical protein